MTQDDVLRMARMAFVCQRDEYLFGEMLERFAALVAAHERERADRAEAEVERLRVERADRLVSHDAKLHEYREKVVCLIAERDALLREQSAWRTEAARWLRRRADVEEWASEKTGWANPARQMPATLRRIAEQLEAEQEEAPYGMDCLLEPRHEPLTEDEVRRLYRGAWTPESEANEVLAFARAVERAHGIGTDE